MIRIDCLVLSHPFSLHYHIAEFSLQFLDFWNLDVVQVEEVLFVESLDYYSNLFLEFLLYGLFLDLFKQTVLGHLLPVQ